MATVGNYFEAVFLTVVCVVALMGNISLFLIVKRSCSLQKTSNYFTLNLAFADILVSLVNMPVTIYTILQQRWSLGDFACKAIGFINILSFIASVMSLALIAINRYCFVVHWKSYRRYFSSLRVKIYIILNWFFSGLLSFPPLVGWSSFGYVPGKSYCFVLWFENTSFVYFMVIVCFFGPLITMGICYTKILLFTKNAKQNLESTTSVSGPSSSAFRNVSVEETRLTNTLMIVLGVFVICWSPFAITMFFELYDPDPLPRWVDMGSLLLGYVNSLCNPIIYSVRNPKFRKGFFELYSLCGIPWFKRNSHISTVEEPQDPGEHRNRQNVAALCDENNLSSNKDGNKNIDNNEMEKKESLNVHLNVNCTSVLTEHLHTSSMTKALTEVSISQ